MRKPTIGFKVQGGCLPALQRVLVFSENINATYYISFELPFRELLRTHDLAWFAVDGAGVEQWLIRRNISEVLAELWSDIEPSRVVLTRYAGPHAHTIIRYFQKRGVPCIYHLDDDLLRPAASLGAEVLAWHGRSEVVDARRQAMAASDVIYVSTPRLGARLAAEFGDKVVFGAIYRQHLGSTRQEGEIQEVLTVGYMGSKGHAEDLAMIAPSLAALFDYGSPSIQLELFGSVPLPRELESFRTQIKHLKPTPDYFAFLERLASLRWDIGLAPLADNAFNSCKAPTKFLEYTEAGMVTIASDVAVYSEHATNRGHPTMILCKHPVAWADTILELAESSALREKLQREAANYCARVFDPQVLARQVADILVLGSGTEAASLPDSLVSLGETGGAILKEDFK